MHEDSWTKQRATDYLQNFWEPQKGSQILIDGEYTTIKRIEEDYPEQVELEGKEKIYFIQDLKWTPTMDEIFSIFESLGIGVHSDSISYNRIFKPKPQDLIEAAKSLVDLRVVSMIRPDQKIGL